MVFISSYFYTLLWCGVRIMLQHKDILEDDKYIDEVRWPEVYVENSGLITLS
jgi:hypothetical protein